MEKLYDRIILGMDPGTQVMGYGIIGISGNKPEVIAMGVIRLGKTEDHFLRIKKIFEETIELIEKHSPDELSIEAPFFGKNVQSMLKLGRAQGVAMAAALSRQLPIFEYSPKRIKQSITGNGNASKEQVSAMLHRMFRQLETSEYLDATDGLAAALCHFFQDRRALLKSSADIATTPVKGKKTGIAAKAVKAVKAKGKRAGWEEFVALNPGRVQAK